MIIRASGMVLAGKMNSRGGFDVLGGSVLGFAVESVNGSADCESVIAVAFAAVFFVVLVFMV